MSVADHGLRTLRCRAIDLIALPTGRQTTAEGTLIAPAQIARTGIQLYTAGELALPGVDPNRTVRVLRPDDEVFHPEAMKSFELKPLANDHPPGDITADNWQRYAADGRVVGDVANIDRTDGYLTAQLHIRDKKAVDAVNAGKSQLSCGYSFDADQTPGTWKGQPYDLVQRNIRGNHVAIVDVARGGPGCRVGDRQPKAAADERGQTAAADAVEDLSDPTSVLRQRETNRGRLSDEQTTDEERQAMDEQNQDDARRAAMDNLIRTTSGPSDGLALGIADEAGASVVDVRSYLSRGPETVASRQVLERIRAACDRALETSR